MDDYLSSFFADDKRSKSFSLTARPEIHDALCRVLRLRKLDSGFIVVVGQPSATRSAAVNQLHIAIICEYGSVPLQREYVIWVDGFELMFKFIDVADWSEWGSNR